MRTLRLALRLSILGLLATTLAASQDSPAPTSRTGQMRGFYVNFGAGPNWQMHNDPVIAPTFFDPDDLAGEWNYNTGWKVDGGGGYAFGNGFRLEGELGYGRNGIAEIFDTDDLVFRKAHGSRNQLHLMFNAAYDFYTHSRWVPYVGVGVGGARQAFDNAGALDEGPDDNVVDNADYWKFAWQGFGGLDYLATSHLRLGVRYRYLHANGIDRVTDPNLNALTFDSSQHHSVMFTMQYNFGSKR